MFYRLILFIFLSFFISCKSSNNTETLVLQPGPEEGVDASIEEYPFGDYNNRNFGNADSFIAMHWTANSEPFIIRSFINFDLSGIPSNVEIENASLSLFATEVLWHETIHHGENATLIQKVTSSWTEDEVTWNNQPSTTTENQVTLRTSSTPDQDYIDIDVTNLIRTIYSDPSGGYGMMMKLKNESETNLFSCMIFGSSDNEDVSKRPKLSITYSK